MKLLYHSLAFYLALVSPSATATPSATSTSAAKPSTTPPLPCTIRSPNTHAFFDLNPLHISDPATSTSKHPRDRSWNATGWDMGYNFTMNFCGGVVEDLGERGGVVGVEKGLWRNVSAFYEMGGKVYSIGQQNSVPVLRGRKLVVNYTDGSPCDADAGKRSHIIEDLSSRAILGDDDDDEDNKKQPKKPSKGHDDDDEPKKPTKTPSTHPVRRKNTVVSFLCDRDPLAQTLLLSFISSSPDQCTYFFEARSSAGCGGIETAKQTLSPSGVFGMIVGIAFLVYIVGGCVYSRVVLQQRGWRQLPNYALWSSMGRFIKDIFIILTSSCARFLPSRRGYQRVSDGGIGSSGNGSRGERGRGDSSDAENRLIDELNEEWED
ncbi:Cation-independent mannose-6-phosphate receptor CI-MPR [Friedmanniomyces endolithicus]|nr:Cation-independent mannose-6-phosphate receptor CI-MPR [Friedmanniomyces endolithicus]